VTQPDGNVPDSAITSLAALAARTQEEWEDILRGRTVDPFEKFIDGFFDDLGSGLEDGVKFIMALMTKLARALTFGMPGISFGSLGEAFDWLQLKVPVTLTEHTEAIARLEDVTAATRTTVAYVGDIQDMVSVPRSQLVTIGTASAKATDILNNVQTGNGGSSPSSTFSTVRAMPVIVPDVRLWEPTGAPSLGTVYYTPIVVDRHGTVDKLRWIVGADGSIWNNNFYEVALCAYIPETGAIEKVWTSGDIKDTYANTSTLAEVEIAMGIEQACTPGQLLFGAHQQTANGFGQQPRSFAAVPQADVGRPSSLLLDAASYRLHHYSQGIPSTIQLADLTRENRFIPWMAVSVNSTPVEEP